MKCLNNGNHRNIGALSRGSCQPHLHGWIVCIFGVPLGAGNFVWSRGITGRRRLGRRDSPLGPLRNWRRKGEWQ